MESKAPAFIAAAIAGGTIGGVGGFMVRGEGLENSGFSEEEQIKGAAVGGLTYGLVGTGVGLGTVGATMAIKKILRK
jgi:hypothetical protein